MAILSENRPEWAVADFATMLLGAVVVPIYTTLTREQTLHLLRDSGARILFVSTPDQLRKLQAISDQCDVEKIVVMDYIGAPTCIPHAAPDAERPGSARRGVRRPRAGGHA